MRIQLNKVITKEAQLEEYQKNRTLSKIIWKQSGIHTRHGVYGKYTAPQGFDFYQWESTNDLYIAYCCDSCGVEFYGEWKVLGLGGFCSNPEETNSYFPYVEERVIEELKRNIETENKHVEKILYKDIASDIIKIKTMDVCPCCGNKINRSEGHLKITASLFTLFEDAVGSLEEYKYRYYPKKYTSIHGCKKEYKKEYSDVFGLYGYSGINEVYEELKSIRLFLEEKEADEKIRDYTTMCNLPVVSTIQSDKIQNIKNAPDKLKEYIFNLLKLEANIYSLEKRLVQLYYQKNEYDRNAIFVTYSPRIKLYEEALQAEADYSNYSILYEQYRSGILPFEKPIEPKKPLLKESGIFNKKKVQEENERLKAKYDEDLKTYNEKMQQYEVSRSELLIETEDNLQKAKSFMDEVNQRANNFVPESNNDLPEIHLKELLDNEILNAETLLNKTYKCRNELYSLNIVFEKYRNPVALSTFYEYLMAGRCMSLEGANGAYNIYEQEVRANIIIDKLDKVIATLETIKESQYTIYQELRTINQNLNRLNKTVSEISNTVKNIDKTTREIEYNTAATAYYSKINAELTNSLGLMVALS